MMYVTWMTDVNLTTVSLFSVTFVLTYMAVRLKERRNPRGPPCLPSLPFIGSIPFMPMDFAKIPKFFMETADKLGPVFALYSGQIYTVILNGRKAIDDALLRRSLDFVDRGRMYFEKYHTNVNEKGVVFVHYTEDFKKQRRSVLSTLRFFGFGKKNLTELKVHAEFARLQKEIDKFDGRSFNPSQLIGNFFASFILNIILGRQFEYEDPALRQIIHTLDALIHESPFILDYFPLARFLPTVKQQLEHLKEEQRLMFDILDTEVDRCLKNSTEDSFVKRFLEEVGLDYDREQLLFIMRDLIGGGTDTSTNLSLFALATLANHPDIQNRIRREISSVVPNSRFPSLDDQLHLPYTDAFIAELMRHYPILPLALLHMTLNDTEVNGFLIPAGTQVIVNLYSAHMDPKVWLDPEQFKPDRFLDEDGKFVGGERVIPFSLGKRSCLGEVLARHEFFVFFATLLQQFEILPPEGQHSVEIVVVCNGALSPSPFEIRMIPVEIWKQFCD